MASASRFSSVWETIVPSTTGSVSRARPSRRATISAREGSPRRAGRVDDMSTPMNVPCIASRRLARRQVGATTRIECQASARTNIAAHITARPAASRPGFDASSEAATRATPMRCSASAASPAPSSELLARPSRRSARARRGRPSADAGAGTSGCSDGSRWAGTRGSRSAGANPWRTADAGQARGGLAHGEGLLVAVEHFGGDVRPSKALGALARGGGHPRAAVRFQSEQAQSLGQRERIAGGHELPVDAVAQDVAISRDVGGEHGRADGQALGDDHAEALTAQGGRAQHVRARELGQLARLGYLAERADGAIVEGHVRDLLG